MQGSSEMFWFFYKLFGDRPKGAQVEISPGVKFMFGIGAGLLCATSAFVAVRSSSRKPLLASVAAVQSVATFGLAGYFMNNAYQQHTHYNKLWAEEYENLRRERRERKLKNGE